MSLSGNLGFVPIDEVLRLLTRSHQQGSVAVTGMGLHGRVFIGKGGIDLATTSDDSDLHRHLVNSGYADQRALNRIANGETTLAALAEANAGIVELIREMTVESLYQIAARGDEFVVHEGISSPYASPKSFELEALMRDMDERRKEWDSVSSVIPDLNGGIGFCSDLGDREEVTVKSDDWKVLSEIGSGASVREIADHLGTTEFWTARVAARLIQDDLVALTTADDAHDDYDEPRPANYDDVEGPASIDEHVAYAADEQVSGDDAHGDDEQFGDPVTPVFETSDTEDTEAESDESWWQEPANDDEDPDEDTEARTPEVVSEGLSEIPAVESRDEEVEEDTEAFLEKVFSELDSSDSEAEEGHGLLRRRRMGTLRDFSSDS